jgi:CHRD domain
MKKTLLKTLYFLPLIFISFSIFAQVDDPRARMEAEIALIKDPATGKIPIERLVAAREEIKKRLNKNVAVGGITWNERGPNNIGGRTRAVVFDPNDATAKKVWAGGVGGGLWYNTDITSAATVWQKVDDFWANIAISSIVFDPANTQNIYVGTGEGWFNVDAQQGAGIWKSSNGGVNWTQLASTASNTDFNFVQKIIVNSTGAVFAATQGGVYKSTDGGATWTINLKPTTLAGAVAPVNNFAADLEIGTDGVIYASFGNAGYQGSRVFKTADAGTTWTQITSDANQYRTEIALAPSTSGATQVIYAITQSGGYTTAWLRKSVDAGANWTDATPSSSLTGNQAWYDLILAVKPNDPNIVIGGGNVIGRTTNGSTWVTRGYYAEGLHPDHHDIVFRPGFPNEIVNGNDGGIYYSPDYGNAATVTPTFNMRNNGFNVTQYYGAAIKNIAGDGYVLAGSQDNGTHRINSSLNTIGVGTQVTGGDGMLCFIDQDQPDFQITSYQVGSYNFYNAATNVVTGLGIGGTQFVGPSDYNSNQNVLYAERSSTTMNRVGGIGGATSNSVITHTSVGGTSLIRCGLIDNTVYVGGYNGNIIKITNAGNVGGVQAITTIASGFAGVVSCVEIGATENELLVTRSNYGVKSVHYTTDGGTTWISKDEVGYGLPDIPVRFALFNPANRKQVLLATELGVFSTTDVTLTNPGWEPTNASLANVSCYMLRYRTADGTVAVATHGRGVYTTNFCAFPTINSPSSNTVCSNQAFNYTATTGSAGAFTFAWTRAAIAGISNAASSGSNANVNETLINTTTNPVTVTYLFTISPNPCGGLVQQAVNVTVNPTVTPTVASYSVCQNGTVPSGQGLVVPTLPSTTINGLLTTSSPTYVRADGNNATVYVSSGVTAYYQTFTFVAPASGNTSLEIVAAALTGSDPYDTYMSLYQTSFNPASPATNFLRGDDDSGGLQYSSRLTHNLVAGTTYIIVVSTYSSGVTGTFTIESSPAIFSGGVNNWYTAASGGSVLTTGEIFNPVGLSGSGIPNTATVGTTTFFVANALYPTCRTAATFSVIGTTVTAGSNSPVTAGGTINLTATTTGTSFAWAGPNSFTSTAQNPAILSATTAMAGVYTINVTSTAGTCVATAMATTNVVVNPVPTSCSPPTGATAGSNSPVLVGGTINLTSSSTGGTSQVWAGPSAFNSTAQNPTIPSATAGMAGVYTVTITSSGTCTATATVNVVINPVPTSCTTPTATASTNSPICAGTPLNLTATCTGSISATLSGTSEVPANASTATGSVTGTFDPVSNVITVNVNFNGLSAVATAAHIHSGAVGVNGGVIVGLTGFPSAVSGTYSNSFTLTAPQAASLASGGLYVNIHNSSFPGGEIRGQIALSTCTFAWTGVNGFSSTAQNPTIPSATTAATGTYQVVVTAAGGCTAMATTSATVNAVPTGATAGSNSPVLVGGTINLTSSSTGGTSQVWAGPSGFNSTAQNPTIASATAGMAGVYTVTISSGTCTATATVNVVVNPLPTSCSPPTGATASSNSPVLVGGTINLTSSSTGGTSQVWAGPSGFNSTAQNPTIASATTGMAGVYTVTITSSGTCTATATTNVSVMMPPTATVVFVNIANVAAPTQDGNSWATAFGNLQTALSLAPANSEIWVAQGVYKPTTTLNRTIAFNIPSGAMLFGGFAGTETAQSQRNFMTNSTILSGEIGSVATVSDNSYHVVTFIGVSNSTVLDGFTVMAGNANLTSDRTRPLPGPTVQPLSINDGGGIGLDNGSSPMIINCRIISNDAIQGGGLFATNSSNPTVKNSTFMSNQATFGGATYHLGSNPVYQDVLIAGNKATGGAMYNNGSNPTVTNVTMAGNGGVNGAVFNSGSTPVIKNSILWGNITPFNDIQSIISYSIVEGGYPGVGNLNLNPQFVNLFPHGLSPTLSGDYKLTNTSPAIDAGDNGMIGLTDKDLMGNLRRFNGGIVDIGAYEFQGSRIGGTVTSIISGNWEMGTTWDIGRKPLAGDMVIINDNHIVTVNADGVLKNIELRPNAKVMYSTAGIKLQTGF